MTRTLGSSQAGGTMIGSQHQLGVPPTFEPALLFVLAPAFLLYAAGVGRAWRVAGIGRGIGVGRAVAGVLGLVALTAALASPLEPLAGILFSAHMAQHLLLVLVAAPLLVVGVPLLALLWLLPPAARRAMVAAWRRGTARRAWHDISHPVVAWGLFVALLWGWHLPAAYEAAVSNVPLHALEHASLLAGAALFWWSLLQPLGRRRLSRFAAPLSLFAAAAQGGLLGAMITLAPEPWYSHYLRIAETAGFSALADQQLAGLLMWVPPGALYLGVACWMLYRSLASADARAARPRAGPSTARNLLNCAAALIASGLITGVGEAQVLQPAGPAAQAVSTIWWVMLALASAVCLIVFALLLLAVFRARSAGGGRPPLGDGPFVILGGIVVPLVILVPLLLWSLGSTAEIARPSEIPGPAENARPAGMAEPAEPAEEAMTIEVVGHQWWWEVRYPDAGVTDANEIHIPAGRPVRLLLTSADVIHSFWAPGLQGKMDLIPGMVNSLWIEADEPGIHTAKCAEFCGAQHANMRLLVVSEREEGFAEWLAARQEVPPSVPSDPLVRKGQEIFLGSACVYCHTIEGTNASGRVGPDLTHVAGRMTLGAGTLANNRGNLGGWIVNSQAHKPGNRMPPMYLESADLQALLAYLESLE
jgi:cytochrome c oxidase subunit 2